MSLQFGSKPGRLNRHYLLDDVQYLVYGPYSSVFGKRKNAFVRGLYDSSFCACTPFSAPALAPVFLTPLFLSAPGRIGTRALLFHCDFSEVGGRTGAHRRGLRGVVSGTSGSLFSLFFFLLLFLSLSLFSLFLPHTLPLTRSAGALWAPPAR